MWVWADGTCIFSETARARVGGVGWGVWVWGGGCGSGWLSFLFVCIGGWCLHGVGCVVVACWESLRV